MKEQTFYIIAFDSTHEAIRMERMLKQVMDVTMIPTPRELTVSCGLSIKLTEEQVEHVKASLKNIDEDRIKLFFIDRSGEETTATQMSWR